MVTPHSPGPWTIGESVQDFHWPILSTSEAGHVDNVGVVNMFTAKHRHEAFANAQLIAAAPELLRACKLVLSPYKDGSSDARYTEVEVREILRAAIAKTEGSTLPA